MCRVQRAIKNTDNCQDLQSFMISTSGYGKLQQTMANTPLYSSLHEKTGFTDGAHVSHYSKQTHSDTSSSTPCGLPSLAVPETSHPSHRICLVFRPAVLCFARSEREEMNVGGIHLSEKTGFSPSLYSAIMAHVYRKATMLRFMIIA
jgi:hypothetical protein